SGSRLIIRKVGCIELRLYAAPAYLQQYGVPESVDDLANHRFVNYIDDMVQIDEVRWLYDAIREPNVVFRSTSIVSQKNAAAQGMGLAMLPTFLAHDDPRLQPVSIK